MDVESGVQSWLGVGFDGGVLKGDHGVDGVVPVIEDSGDDLAVHGAVSLHLEGERVVVADVAVTVPSVNGAVSAVTVSVQLSDEGLDVGLELGLETDGDSVVVGVEDGGYGGVLSLVEQSEVDALGGVGVVIDGDDLASSAGGAVRDGDVCDGDVARSGGDEQNQGDEEHGRHE